MNNDRDSRQRRTDSSRDGGAFHAKTLLSETNFVHYAIFLAPRTSIIYVSVTQHSGTRLEWPHRLKAPLDEAKAELFGSLLHQNLVVLASQLVLVT